MSVTGPDFLALQVRDLERAAATAPYGVFDNAGQDCCARSRILVQRSEIGDLGGVRRGQWATGGVGRRGGGIDVVRPAVGGPVGPLVGVVLVLQDDGDLAGQSGDEIGDRDAVGVVAGRLPRDRCAFPRRGGWRRARRSGNPFVGLVRAGLLRGGVRSGVLAVTHLLLRFGPSVIHASP